MPTIQFSIAGAEAGSAIKAITGLTLARTIAIGVSRGEGAQDTLIEADPKRHVVALAFAGGPTLYVNPADVAALLGSTGGTSRGADGVAEGVVRIGAALPGVASRGIGDMILSGFGLFDLGIDKAADLATPKIAGLIENSVNPGVWKLACDTLPVKTALTVKMPANTPVDQALLIFIHGTGSCTGGGFAGLWLNNKDMLRELFGRYPDRVFALDHKTLTESPIQNAIALAEALPQGARVHLVTHSRGGLVADLLSRAQRWPADGDASGPAADPFDAKDIQAFAGEKQYEGYGALLEKLGALLKSKRIIVERVVRVASPSRGTILASRRLDLYLSTLSWLVGKAADAAAVAGLIPVAGVIGAAEALAKLAAAIAHNRTDAEKLPGIEAMMPERKIVAMLNRTDVRVGGDLRAIAGDIETGDSFGAWLKVKLVDAFYWEDHDLVVNTSSMDKGPRRLPGKASRLFDQGPKVDHFSYFSNRRTARALNEALKEPPPTGFTLTEAAGESVGRGARAVRGEATPERPAVVVLHGIMGSNLKAGDVRVWFRLGRIVVGDFPKLAFGQAGVTPDGLIGRAYDRLLDTLAATHEVIPFAYDWRAPIEDASRQLERVVSAALDARKSSRQPVRIVAHSMGGLVTRALQWQAPQTWERMMSNPGARILMLGVPNQGSMTPAAVLTGRDAFVNMLEGVDLVHGPKEFLAVAAGFPGFLQLLACAEDSTQDWYSAAAWEALLSIDKARPEMDFSGESPRPIMRRDWTAPTQAVLDSARAFQRKLAQQDLKPYADRIHIVHGCARETPVRAAQVDGAFEFECVAEGDGRVTWKAGRIPEVKTSEWYVDAAHGDLADAEDAFIGYVQLLRDGTTLNLATTPPKRGFFRSADGSAAAPDARSRYGFAIARFPATEEELVDAALGAWPRVKRAERHLPAVAVKVLHANLRYIDDPVMLGHQAGTGLYSAEKFLDGVFKQRLSEAIRLEVYPGPLGTSDSFLPPQDDSGNGVRVRPERAIIVGLGEVGELTPANLQGTVGAALVRYAQREAQRSASDGKPLELSVASLLIGTGASNISVADSVQAIMFAVQDANARLAQAELRPDARFVGLTFVDYYENMAIEALRAALMVAKDRPALQVAKELARKGAVYERNRLKPDAGGWPQFISITENQHGELVFSLATDRARSQVLEQATQRALIDRLVRDGEASTGNSDAIGEMLFELLVPNDLKEDADAGRALVLDVDAAAAAYPWEMLIKTVNGNQRRLSLIGPVVRKLKLTQFRKHPNDARGRRALVIGAPLCPTLPRLPGALAEAQEVARVLQADHARGAGADAEVKLLPERPMLEILRAVFDKHWRIMHFAGHGMYRPKKEGEQGHDLSGMVLSDGVALSPIEIGQMRSVPQLVFVNCCSLGKIEPGMATEKLNETTLTSRRGEYAANLAEQLIRNGVRCVVAAAWAVDDNAASEFARTFYSSLLDGAPFGQAVLAAREMTFRRHPNCNTWAAYQCYGDLEWRYQEKGSLSASGAGYQEILVESELLERLEAILVQSDGAAGGTEAHKALTARLAALERDYGAKWNDSGEVAESFAAALAALGDMTKAIDWYDRAVRSHQGNARFKAMEQWINLRVRAAQAGGLKKRKDVEKALAELQALIGIAPTPERRSLMGSAYKRMALLLEPDSPSLGKTLDAMQKAYENAIELTSKAKRHASFYPAMNAAAAAIGRQLAAGETRGEPALKEAFTRCEQLIAEANNKAADFWTHTAEIELALYRSLHAGSLTRECDALQARYTTLAGRSGTRREWGSVRDQLEFLLFTTGKKAQPRSRVATRTPLDKLFKGVSKLAE